MKNLILRVDYKGKLSDRYVCTIDNQDGVSYSGIGENIAEAVGDCIISNRELLNISLYGIRQDGMVWSSAGCSKKCLELGRKLQEKLDKEKNSEST